MCSLGFECLFYIISNHNFRVCLVIIFKTVFVLKNKENKENTMNTLGSFFSLFFLGSEEKQKTLNLDNNNNSFQRRQKKNDVLCVLRNCSRKQFSKTGP